MTRPYYRIGSQTTKVKKLKKETAQVFLKKESCNSTSARVFLLLQQPVNIRVKDDFSYLIEQDNFYS